MATRRPRRAPNAASLTQAVHEATRHLQITPADTGTVQLAAEYAQAIDAAGDRGKALELLGPKLLAALEQLGATPKARAAVVKGGPDGSAKRTALDELRDRRATRANRAKTVDTPAP